MRSKLKTIGLVVGLAAMLSGTAFAGKKHEKHASNHVALGTIASIDANQVVVNEKVKGKEQPVTFQMDSSTQKSGNLTSGTPVTIQYHTANNQNVATSVRERGTDQTAKKPTAKSTKGSD